MNRGGDKIFEDKYAKQASDYRDDLPQNFKEIEASQALKKDLKEPEKREPTRWERKCKRIFGAAGNTANLFKTGFMMGGLVGGAFGGILGLYQAIQFRRPIIVFQSMIGSGVSFGFFMGLGMTIRSGEM